jgi:DNA-binding PadR family transcriptional regulator
MEGDARVARAERDLSGLTVLALLLTGPRHTYEMHRMMIDTHKDFVTGLPRSMYHAVERLLRDQLIRVVGTARNGSRPERTVYELTAAGHAELPTRVRRLLEQPDPDATLLVAALSFIGCLPPVEASAALWARCDALSARGAELRREHDEAAAVVPRVLLVEAEFEIARCTTEQEWVAALAADIDSGRLDWPADIGSLVALLDSPAGRTPTA